MPTVLHYVVDMGTDIWTDHMIEKLPLSPLPFFLQENLTLSFFLSATQEYLLHQPLSNVRLSPRSVSGPAQYE